MRGIIYLYFLLLLLFLFVCYANSDLQWTMETNQHNTMSTTGLVAESRFPHRFRFGAVLPVYSRLCKIYSGLVSRIVSYDPMMGRNSGSSHCVPTPPLIQQQSADKKFRC